MNSCRFNTLATIPDAKNDVKMILNELETVG